MQRWSGVLLLVLMACVSEPERDVLADATRRGNDIEVRIRNNRDNDILAISPNRPNRQLDEDRCKLLLSTKVQEWITPYAFTPELIEIKAGESRVFLVEFSESGSATCREWDIGIEYAYLQANAARDARRDEANFRQYVLSHQQIAHTTTSLR